MKERRRVTPCRRQLVFREVSVEERSAVLVHGDGPGYSESLLVVRPAREDGNSAYAGLVRGFDVPDGVTDGDGLVRGRASPQQSFVKDVGCGLGVLDIAGVDDAGELA